MFALLRANLVFSFSCDFYTSRVGSPRIWWASGLEKNLSPLSSAFPTLSFFFFFQDVQNASQPAERKFIFWAVRTNFPLCPIMPICLSPPPPASHRERISPKLLIAEKRIKMNFPHERRDKFPNFRSMTQIFRLLTTAGLRLSRVKENQGATLCRFRVVASLPFSLFAYSRPFTTRYNLHRSDFRRGDLG